MRGGENMAKDEIYFKKTLYLKNVTLKEEKAWLFCSLHQKGLNIFDCQAVG